MSEKAIFDDFSKFSTNSILQLLHDNDLMKYSTTFRENKITGWDLCYITEDTLQNELKVNSFHDRREIFKIRERLLLEQCKEKLKF